MYQRQKSDGQAAGVQQAMAEVAGTAPSKAHLEPLRAWNELFSTHLWAFFCPEYVPDGLPDAGRKYLKLGITPPGHDALLMAHLLMGCQHPTEWQHSSCGWMVSLCSRPLGDFRGLL